MNYHDLQRPIEERYHKLLVAIFKPLFDELNKTVLDRFTIHAIFKQWLIINHHKIQAATLACIRDLNQVADLVMASKRTNFGLEQTLIKANENLIGLEVSKLRDKVSALAVQAHTYGMPRTAVEYRLNDLTSATINALELLAVNSAILNTRELILNNAVQDGYSEYLGKTQDDEKVRETHYIYYHNQWIHVDYPPIIGHIGCEVNCRCEISDFR